MSKKGKERHPRVFISYSHDSPEHASKILEFAKQLREDGIDAILDQYEPWPEKGWPQWMLQQVSEADFVLMICTEMYYKGVMDKLDPGEKRGIKYEWNLINSHFYKTSSVNKRFLPVLLEKTFVGWIPDPFQGMPWFCIATDEEYEDLYRRLTKQPKTQKPHLGKLKSLGARQPKTNFFQDTGEETKKNRSGKEAYREGIPKRLWICALLIIMILILLWIDYKTYCLDLQASVGHYMWKPPYYLTQELGTVEESKQNRYHIMDSNSMYCIMVRNDGAEIVNHVVMTIPDVNYVEVMREGKNPEEIRPSEMITLEKLQVEEEICVIAWAASPLSRYNAKRVAIYNEDGKAPLYIKTPIGAIALLINKYITKRVVLFLIVGILACLALCMSIKKCFRIYRLTLNKSTGI